MTQEQKKKFINTNVWENKSIEKVSKEICEKFGNSDEWVGLWQWMCLGACEYLDKIKPKQEEQP